MKRLTTILVLLLLTSVLNAQPWFDIGIKGGIGSSFMYNKQIFDKQTLTHQFKPGYGYGAKLGFNFIQEHQITFDIMQSSFSQGFIYYPEAGLERNREYSIQSRDLLLMYRSNRKGTYFEVGPQWSTITKVDFSDNNISFPSTSTPDDIINKSMFSIALGFGGYVFGTDNFGITTGIRLNYTLNDIASDEGRELNFPFLDSAESDATRNLGVMFVVEMNYDFGYLVSSSCGQRTKLFVF